MKNSGFLGKAILILCVTALGFIGCTDDGDPAPPSKGDDAALEKQCSRMNTNIASLQAAVAALQSDDHVTGAESLTEESAHVGYTIRFAESDPIVIYDCVTPLVAVAADGDAYFWTLNGEFLLDGSGSKAPVGGDTPGPRLKIDNGAWMLSCDGGNVWSRVEPDAEAADIRITQDDGYVRIDLNGTVLALPKAGSTPEPAFEIIIKDVTTTTVTFDINVADDNMRYIFMCIEKEYADLFEDDEALFQDDIAYFSESIGYGFDTLSDVIEAYSTTGDHADLQQSGLNAETEYLFYAYGLELDGTRTTDIHREYITTMAIEKLDITFEIEAIVEGTTIDASVTPSDNDCYYYFDAISRESLDVDFDGDIAAAAKYYIDYNVEMGTYYGMSTEEVILEIASQGPDQYYFLCSPSTEYIIFVMAVSTDGSIISDVATKSVTTGEVKPSDNQITIAIDSKTSTSVTVSTTTTNDDPYFLGIEPAVYYKDMTDEQIIEEIIGNYGEYIAYATENGNVEALELVDLEPGTEYLVMAFGIQLGNATTGLVKQPVTTEAGNDPTACTFDIAIDKLTSTSVTATVTPSSDDVRYFWNLVETGLSDDKIMADIQTDIDNWVASGAVSSAYEYWRMITYTGVDTWEYEYLTPNTTYDIYVVPIDLNTCSAAAPFTRMSITTLAADQAFKQTNTAAHDTLHRRAVSPRKAVSHRAAQKDITRTVAPMRTIAQRSAKHDNPKAKVSVRHSALLER